MIYRYFIWIQYDGSCYSGWQVQPNAITVQEVLEKALSTLLKEQVQTVGVGRTDAGVHARNFAAHFDYSVSLSSTGLMELAYKLNCLLPSDIAVIRIEQVKPDIHARYSATSRTYHYLISTCKNPFLVNRAWFFGQSLSLEAMQLASHALLNHENFESFCKSNSGTSNYRCKITKASWVEEEGLLRFEITADRFLRNMVRAIVGTMVDVGLGKITVEDFNEVIESSNRSNAGLSVPACGLYLEEVVFPLGYIIVGKSK